MPIHRPAPFAVLSCTPTCLALAALALTAACESGGASTTQSASPDASAPLGGDPAPTGGDEAPAGGTPAPTGGTEAPMGGAGGTPTGGVPADADAGAAGAGGAGGASDATAGPPDAAAPPEPDAGGPDPGCPDRPVIAPDADRVVLIGHPFTDDPEVRGTEIHGLTLRSDGVLLDDGIRLDVGVRVARIEFAPHGLLAFALGEDGDLVSVFVAAAEGMAVVDRVRLPGADYGDLHVSADGATVWVTGSNVDETSGISTVHVDCDGRLTVDDAAYFPLRLSESTAFLPGEQRALLLGGQTAFEPLDDDDVRLLERLGDGPGQGFRQVGAFDLYHDFVSAGRIAVSPDGTLGAIPNNSAFSDEGGQMMVVAIDGDAVTEVERVLDVFDASEALFSLDGQTLVLSQVEPGLLGAYRIEDGHITDTQVLRGVGLADQMARVARGPLADTLLIPSIDPNGEPNITMVRISGPGELEDLGETPLGAGIPNIATPIAVQP